MPDPIVQYESAPFNGPLSENSLLLDTVTASPFEGLWVPTKFLKNGCIELSAVGFTSTTVQLIGTNLDSVATFNQQRVTVGGSATATDVVTLAFKNSNLLAGSESVSYTVQVSDTLTLVAAGLVAAINADTKLAALGITASNSGAVITVSYPSVPANAENISPSAPSQQNTTIITTSLSGGASETLTVAVGTNGTQIGSNITALGFTALSVIPRYVKARVTALTATNISLGLQGAG